MVPRTTGLSQQGPGIDHSLFWDDDGHCYYIGHGNLEKDPNQKDPWGVWMQELDTEKSKLVGEAQPLTFGFATNAVWTEGPHLYKIQGKYLLLVAEGGTEYNHSVAFFCSNKLWGPYVPNLVNPAISHRHLGKDYPVYAVGHADLVETQNGDWWSVMLARETFLTPVKMEMHDGALTPIYNPGLGRLKMEQKRPNLPWTPVKELPVRDEFDGDQLRLEWNFLRAPMETWYSLEEGALTIQLRPQVADSMVNPSMVVRRIEDHRFDVACRMKFSSKKENEQAGIIIYRNSQCHYQLLKSKKDLVLIKTMQGSSGVVARVPWDEKEVVLTVKANRLDVSFQYGPSLDEQKQIGDIQNMNVISDEISGLFNGPYVGMYATSNGAKSKTSAAFEWFEYRGEK